MNLNVEVFEASSALVEVDQRSRCLVALQTGRQTSRQGGGLQLGAVGCCWGNCAHGMGRSGEVNLLAQMHTSLTPLGFLFL